MYSVSREGIFSVSREKMKWREDCTIFTLNVIYPAIVLCLYLF